MFTKPSTVNLIKLWKASSELTVGEITRYRIRLDLKKLRKSTAWPPYNLVLKVTNTTPVIYTVAVLAGPFNISASCVETKHNGFITFKQPLELIEPQTKTGIKCGETWKITLNIPDEVTGEEWIGDWIIEILSDIVFTSNKVQYDVSLFAVIANGASVTDEINITSIKKPFKYDYSLIETYSPAIIYEYFKPKDVFRLPDLITINRESENSQNTKSSIHLLVLTHGLHGSMLDELYLREVIEEKCKHQLEHKVVFYMSDANHSFTEDGIENCGKRLAEGILKYVGWPWTSNSTTSISSTSENHSVIGPLISNISFIGHSLGGLINTFVIGYLNRVTNGVFFKDVEPVHFITVASPLLGSADLAWYVKIGLKWGAIGQTGKDLTLSKVEQHSTLGALKKQEDTVDSPNDEPLLLSLSRPNSPSHIALKLFKNRTLYANISNDVFVSLKTSSLYFISNDNDDFIINHSNTTLFDHLKLLYDALNPPETTKEYLTRSLAKSPIIHDKLYTPDDIPPIKNTATSDQEADESFESFRSLPIEEQIARFWHKDMSWRKVLVNLEGEAHTQVIVRRKWLDAAGWRVIEHLLNNHEF